MLLLIRLQLTQFKNRVSSISLGNQFKAALAIGAVFVFLTFMYHAALRALLYLNNVSLIGPALVNKLVAMAFMMAFVMVIFSSLVTSFVSVFNGDEMEWLAHTPLKASHVLGFKTLYSSFYASWMVALAFIPFLAAVAVVKGGAFSTFYWALGTGIPVCLIAGSIGVALSVTLMKVFPYRRTRNTMVVTGVLLFTGVYIMFRLMQPERLVRPEGIEIVSRYLNYLNAPTVQWLPSWWATKGLFSAIAGNSIAAAFEVSKLWLAAIFCFFTTVFIQTRLFSGGWMDTQVFGSVKKPSTADYTRRNQLAACYRKDMKIFFRDTNQWPQLLIMGSLVLVYLFSINRLPLDTVSLRAMFNYLNVGLIGFMLSAVALRFTFPLISLEGDTAWIVRSMPLPISTYMTEKLLFGSIPVVTLAILLSVISNLLVKAELPIFAISLCVALVMAITLSAMSFGFGAIFPRFGITNIAQIESSGGGLLCIAASLFYLAVSMALVTLPMQNYYRGRFASSHEPWSHYWWVVLLFIGISVVAATVPLMLGWKKLEKIEL
jgi:ABC-2 type transport system permease protein